MNAPTRTTTEITTTETPAATTEAAQPPEPTTPRRLKVPAYLGLVAVYLVVVQGVGSLLTRGMDAGYGAPTTIAELVRGITIPVGLSLALGLAVVAALRWWRPAFIESRPVRGWVIAFPIIQAVSIAAMINYGGLAQKGLMFSGLLLLSALFVGFGEEIMFRGIGLMVFRTNGFSEAKAALWTTLIFGAVHSTNLFSEGPKAFGQVFVAAFSGYLFYLARRRTGGLLIPALLHGLWDFSLISGSVVTGHASPLAMVGIASTVVMTILLLVMRKRIEPAATTTATATATATTALA